MDWAAVGECLLKILGNGFIRAAAPCDLITIRSTLPPLVLRLFFPTFHVEDYLIAQGENNQSRRGCS